MPDPRERWVELCEELEAGEIGDVEFFEEALDLGIDLPLIEAELRRRAAMMRRLRKSPGSVGWSIISPFRSASA